MQMIFDGVIDFVWDFIVGAGGGAALAFILFRYFGDRFIRLSLDKNLEVAKSEISLLSARKLRLHDRMLVVLPEIWGSLVTAISTMGDAVNFLRQLPNLDGMEAGELERWIDAENLSFHEKAFFLKERKKTAAYGRILDFRSMRKAHDDFLMFQIALRKNSIFIDPMIKHKFNEIDSLMRSILIDRKMSLDDQHSKESQQFWANAWQKYDKEVKPIMNEIEELVQSKLFPEAHQNLRNSLRKQGRIPGKSDGVS